MAKVGRPRDEGLTRRILASTSELLERSGYAELTVEAVARHAGVSRSTVYKRWPTLPHLVLDATEQRRGSTPRHADDERATPDTGTLRGDLVAVVGHGMSLLSDLGRVGVLRGLLSEALQDPQVSERIREEMLLPDEERLRTVFDRAVERGEIGEARAAEYGTLVPQLLQAFGLVQGVMLRRPVGQDDVESLVDVLLDSVAA